MSLNWSALPIAANEDFDGAPLLRTEFVLEEGHGSLTRATLHATAHGIFEAYLNEVYLGQSGGSAVRGIGAAARAYFGKEVHQLTLAEAALLAGMIRAPNSYSPASNPERSRERRDVVLARMRDLGKISEADYRKARKEPVRVRKAPADGLTAPYFVDYVRAELERATDVELANQHGVRVYTTLDPALQRIAEAAVVRGLDRLETSRPRLRRKSQEERLQAAMIVLDPATGQIRARVGGRDYRASQFNRAVLARRQPGSAFKPFVYLAALTPRRDGPLFTAASMLDDSPLTLVVDGKPWSPRSYDERYLGPVTMRRALERSINTATVRLAQAVGLPAVIETARTLGVEGDLKPVPALALVVFEITPLQLARAYLPLANGGLAPAGGVVDTVTDDSGAALWAASRESRPVIGAPEAFLMTSLLEGVINAGTGAAARALGVPGAVAGKTGTTNEGRDAWFVGYSRNLLALVWVGDVVIVAQSNAAAAVTNPVAATPASVAAGEQTYRKSCAPCHGIKAEGGSGNDLIPASPDLTDDTWDHGSSDGAIFDNIKNGVAPDFNMTPWKDQLKDEEIWNVVNYLRSIAKKK